jgi:hypothetical protein
MLDSSTKIERGMIDPVLADVLDKIHNLTPTLIEQRTGVSHSTIRNWRNGKVRRPQNITMEYALRAAGYKRVIVPL